MSALIEIIQSQINNETVNAVNARELHEKLEVKTHLSTWIKRAIDKYGFEENTDFSILKSLNGANPVLDYIITIDMAKELCLLDDSDFGRQYRKYLIECEKQAKALLPKTYAEALRVLADESEQKELALKIAEEATRTKAEIGSRREATAMNTASTLSKENNKLKIELDKAKEYATVKRMENHFKRKFDWRLLKKTSIEMGYEMPKVYDANYEAGINAYHVDVWLEAFGVWIDDERAA